MRVEGAATSAHTFSNSRDIAVYFVRDDWYDRNVRYSGHPYGGAQAPGKSKAHGKGDG